MTRSLFCDMCGAALPAQALTCAACGHAVHDSSLPPLPQPRAPAPQLSPVTPASSGQTGPLPSGYLLAQRYRIVSQIGQGGFGLIYKAQDCYERRQVAIKQINLAALSPQEMIEATDSYNREIMHLSGLKHECLPRLHDHFTDSAHWYIVLDYIEGETLEDRLKKVRGGRLAPKQVFAVGITLCDVLHYLHSRHPPIIFRDVKPANIMITPRGRLYLIDFGIARYYRPGQVRDTGPLGSPGYAAPEQYGKAQTTVQTDIYGLGATLQTLLTGKEPLEIAMNGMPPHYSMPKKLQSFLARMMERDAGNRPKSMEEVKLRLHYLAENTTEQKTKRVLSVAWDFLQGATLPVLLLMTLVLLFANVTGFVTSPLWTLCLLCNLCLIVGRVAFYLYGEIKEARSRLKVKELLLLAWRRVIGSLLLALIPTMLFYCLYDIQQPFDEVQPLEVFLLVLAACAGIIFLLYRLLEWANRVTRPRNLHLQRQVQKRPWQKQASPLQQQSQKRP
jgi:hypothetical protein